MHEIGRVRGVYRGRNAGTKCNGFAWAVATDRGRAPDVHAQTVAALAEIDRVLSELGTDRTRLLSCTVYLPRIELKDEMDRAWCAWIGDDPVQSRASGEEPPVAAISVVFMDPARREAVRAHIAPHYRLVDIPRCAAEQYPRIVLGQNDVSIFERTLPWDHAAGVLFLNEAGGKAARPDGAPYRVADHTRPGLIGAANPALWDQLAVRMAAFPPRVQNNGTSGL